MTADRTLLDWLWIIFSNFLVFGLLGWCCWTWLKRSNDPVGLAVRWIVSILVVVGSFKFMLSVGSRGGEGSLSAADYGLAFVIAGTAAACGIVLAILWGEGIASFFGGLIGNEIDGGLAQDGVPPPLYSIALAHEKRGDIDGAVAEVRRQLSIHPTDLEGLLMLATLLAEKKKDLEGAREVIEQILTQPDLAPANAAFALNRLADWCLRIEDVDEARAALQRIVDGFPETEQAQYAQQRLAHLASPEVLKAMRAHAPIPVPHLEPLGLRRHASEPQPVEEAPEETLRRYVSQLERHPQDYETREKLALLYAGAFQRLDLAVTELEQLIQLAHAPAKLVVHWLHTLADLYLKHSADVGNARRALERVGERFPNTAAAELARNRMSYLALEAKSKQTSQAIRLGS